MKITEETTLGEILADLAATKAKKPEKTPMFHRETKLGEVLDWIKAVRVETDSFGALLLEGDGSGAYHTRPQRVPTNPSRHRLKRCNP